MKIRFRVAVWTVLTLAVPTLWQGLNDRVTARAQGPGSPPAASAGAPEQKTEGKKIYTAKTYFQLPIKIDERALSNLQKICLYVKAGSDGWVIKESVDPSQKLFKYQVTQDGEYWFSVVTIDKAGNATPAHVESEPPGLMVVVDTQPPDAEVKRAVEGGEVCLRCTVKHAHPDTPPRLSYRGADQAWHDLEPLPGVQGAFRLPTGRDAMTCQVRVNLHDMASKPWSREIQLPDPATAATPPAQTTTTPQASTGPDLLPPDLPNPVTPPSPPKGINTAAASGAALSGAPKSTESTAARPTFEGGIMPVSHNVTTSTTPSAPEPMPNTGNRQLLNTTHASIDYRLDHVGPSGVSKVEVWLTSDQGRSWQRVCDDVDLRTPAELDLPGEGLFGLRLVVTNGNGFGGTPPVRGDAPHYWIEVDNTGPHAQLRDIDPVASGGNLEIHWTASDKNLGAEPVSLFFATRREGPWLPIAHNLKNDGLYRWAFPRDAGSQFFVRMEVTDQAGNVTRCEPSAPVVLDMTEPHAMVVGVTGATVRPTSPSSN